MSKPSFKEEVIQELKQNVLAQTSNLELERIWRTRWLERNWSYILDIAREWRKENLSVQGSRNKPQGI